MIKIVSREDLKRLHRAGIETEEPLSAVQEIIDLVRKKGDEALRTFTLQFDGADVQKWEVSPEEIEEAMEQADPELVRVLTEAAGRIRKFHEHQRQQSWFFTEEDGTVLGQKVIPLEKVGVYVPGGKAAYPSSVLMNVIPAKTAGVNEVIMVTPPLENGEVYVTTLVAAKIAGADRIFRVGGAQAIAALAYGTESIPRVDKIIGPGNVYVALAKRAVFGKWILTASPVRVRSWSLRMNRRIRFMWRPICFPRRNTTGWPPLCVSRLPAFWLNASRRKWTDNAAGCRAARLRKHPSKISVPFVW